MSKSGLWVIAAVAVFTLLGLVYLAMTWEAPTGTTTVVLPAPVEVAPEEPARANPSNNSNNASNSALPSIRIQPQQPEPATTVTDVEAAPPPVEVAIEEPAPEAEAAVQLPSLSASDGFVIENLRGLQNGMQLIGLLRSEQLIRSFVVLVDNVSRNSFPQTDLPYRGMTQEMPVRSLDANLFVMEEAAHGRFDQIVDTFVAVDTAAALAIYRLLSPLMRQAYGELGYGSNDFDPVLRRAIRNVLDMEPPEGPYQLVKPSVMYLYADADIENLSTVEKQLIRLGPENTQQLQQKLRAFLAAL